MQPIIATDSHTATKARAKLDEYIQGARNRAESVITRIMSDVPADQIVHGAHMGFVADPETSDVYYCPPGSDRRHTIHDNAMIQIADRTDIPVAYIRHLQDEARAEMQNTAKRHPHGSPEPRPNWARDLLTRTLREHAEAKLMGTRVLTRASSAAVPQLRAVLSDKFRRIDCRPSLDAALGVAQSYGAVVTDAIASDVRSSVRMILPEVREISPGEFVVLGLSWSNSDYGRGANTMSMFALRLWCLNGATLEQAIRQIHLGARLDANLEYSERTMRLDTAANVSAIKDTTRGLLSPMKVNETINLLQAAAAERIDPKGKLADLRKRYGKSLAEKVGEAYAMPDVEELPPGNTLWRWSNAISWVAKQKDTTPDMRLDLERAAGEVLEKALS